jgi:hypothetical protein
MAAESLRRELAKAGTAGEPARHQTAERGGLDG